MNNNIQKFGLESNIGNNSVPKNTTRIADLSGERDLISRNRQISFLDSAKVKRICFICASTPSKIGICKDFCCFWCRHKIPSNWIPIGIPINFIPNRGVKSYYSEISKDNYTIVEPLTKNSNEKLNNELDYLDEKKENMVGIKIENNGYYETDGFACSFNCASAYIEDNKDDIKYSNSLILLIRMYNAIFKDKIDIISPAPSWRLLKAYGGNISITDFRNNFGNIEYEFHGITRDLPLYLPFGHLYEAQIKF